MKTGIQTNRKYKIISSVLAIIIVGAAYGYYIYLSHYQEGVIPPLAKSTDFISKTFDAQDGIVFHQPTGTHIEIPANVLVNENGEKVKGKVTLKFREFQNAGEIFLSGIPMQLKDDRSNYFSSAGMMEVRVFQNDEPLKIAANKNIAVELASAIQPTSNYKLFQLEDDVNWDKGTTFKTMANSRRDNALKNLPARPNEPISPMIDTSRFIFELISDYKRMPHLKMWKDVKWNFISTEDDLEPQDALRISWEKISIEKISEEENKFKLHFTSSYKDSDYNTMNRSYTMIASPELTGKELAKASKRYESELEKYKIEFAKIDEEEERLMLEADLLNSFRINEFGIFNIDCIKIDSIIAKVDFEFDFENEINPKINKVLLYIILEKERSVFNFNAFDWDEIPLTDTECSLVAVMPNGKAAYISKEAFKKTVNISKIKTGAHFFFKTERKDIADVASLFKTPSNESRLN